MERKLLSSLLCFLLCITVGRAQTLEDFETEPLNQQFFTSGTQVFNITTQAGGTFQIYSVGPGFGWNGTGADDRYIDNFTTKQNNVPFVVTISSAGAVPFVIKSFYGYLANYLDALNVSGSLTVVGKLAGVTQFTATSSTGFNTTLGTQNGFTLINMATYGGSNNSNKAIDQLVLSSTNNYHYIAIDAFKWSPAFTVTSTQTPTSCNGGSNGTATVTQSGGTGPYTYAWSPSGGTAAAATGLSAGSYTCTITDAASVTFAKTVTITQPPAIATSMSSQTNVACFGGSTGAAAINASGGTGTLTYNWTPGNPTGDGTVSVSGLTAGTWTCTVTDANSCTKTQTVTLTQPPSAVSGTTVITNVACFGGSNGSINLTPSGGTNPYTFNWGGGVTTEDRTGLAAGTYTVTITDANSCTGTVNATLTHPASAVSGTTVITNVACFGGSTGSINLTPSGGTNPYTFNWGGGVTTEDRTGLAAGTYTVTITDANSCTGTVNATLTQPASAVTATITSVTNIACYGGTNGSATVAATGGTGTLAYSWTPSGGTAATATGLAAGSYTVTVTDDNMCTTTKITTIDEPDALVATITSVSNVLCHGGTTGAATVAASGGTAPFSYAWAPSGGTAATASGLGAGTYTVTVTDANLCTTIKTASVTEPAAIAETQNVTICAGATLIVGTSTYSVSGTYTDKLQAKNGCDSTVTTNLTVNPPVNTTVSVAANVITANASNSTFQWIDCINANGIIPGAINQSYSAIKSGSYAVIVTTNNCSDTSTCTPIIVTGIDASGLAAALTIYPNPNNGTFTIHSTVAGSYTIINELGQTMYAFQLTGAKDYTANFDGLSNGTYYIIGMNKDQLIKQKIVVIH